jgi:very-short-patch-repair endonuclease
MNRDKPRRWRSSEQMQERAKQLRRRMTPAEAKLWQHLRNGQLNGAWFRRQHPVGPYAVDFFCAKANVVVEVDGDTHADPKQAEYDAERTEWLNEQKHYRVVRFWNSDALNNIEGVSAEIVKTIEFPITQSPNL